MKKDQTRLLNKIFQLEIQAFETFTNVQKQEWGVYFHNSNYKERHDANHAFILNLDVELSYDQLIDQIIDYYHKRDLTPRIVFYHPDKKHLFKKTLAKHGFVTPIYYEGTGRPIKIMTYQKSKPTPPQLPPPANAMVFNANTVNSNDWLGKDILELFQDEQPYQRVSNDKNYYYFVLYVDGTAVSVLSAYTSKKLQYARIDDVFTKKEARHKGYMTYLLYYALNWILRKYNAYLYVYDDQAFRLYKQAGFDILMECHYSHWHLPK